MQSFSNEWPVAGTRPHGGQIALVRNIACVAAMYKTAKEF
jgi:hypothetical protein